MFRIIYIILYAFFFQLYQNIKNLSRYLMVAEGPLPWSVEGVPSDGFECVIQNTVMNVAAVFELISRV